MNGMFLRFCNILANYRNGFVVNSQRYNYPLCQQISGLRRNVEEKIYIPPKPKRPLTPYFKYMVKTRPELIKEKPNLKFTEIVREMSVRWEKVDPKVKETFMLEYNKEQEVYAKQRLEYDTQLTVEQKNALKQLRLQKREDKEKRQYRKKCRDNERPKKPCSAFVLYIKSQLPQRDATQEFINFQRQMAAKWKTMTDTEKKPFVDEMLEQMKEYQKLMTDWEEKMIKLGNTDIVRHDAQLQLEPHVKAPRKKKETESHNAQPEPKMRAPRKKEDKVPHDAQPKEKIPHKKTE